MLWHSLFHRRTIKTNLSPSIPESLSLSLLVGLPRAVVGWLTFQGDLVVPMAIPKESLSGSAAWLGPSASAPQGRVSPGKGCGTCPRQHHRGALRGALGTLCVVPAAGAKTQHCLAQVLCWLSAHPTWLPGWLVWRRQTAVLWGGSLALVGLCLDFCRH